MAKSIKKRGFISKFFWALAGLVVLFHLAGGWYFSGKIGHDALQITGYPKDVDLKLASSTKDSVTITDPGAPNENLRSRKVYGFGWEGGYAQLRGPAQVAGEQVTRAAKIVGTPPPAGMTIDLSRDSFSDISDQGGKQISYKSGDLGEFVAKFFPGNLTTWAILVHGRGATYQEMTRMSLEFRERGYPTMLISYRGDANQPRDASELHQFGYTEKAELLAAIEYASGQGAEKFVLAGASMGGAIVAATMRELPAEKVSAVVMDSPVLSFAATVDFGAEQLGYPIPPTLSWVAKRLTELRYGVKFSQMDYLSNPDWVKVPTLIFHGNKDNTIPVATSIELANTPVGKAKVQLVLNPEANHVESWNISPVTYQNRLAEFLDALPKS